jgi:hypothetical protein
VSSVRPKSAGFNGTSDQAPVFLPQGRPALSLSKKYGTNSKKNNFQYCINCQIDSQYIIQKYFKMPIIENFANKAARS